MRVYSELERQRIESRQQALEKRKAELRKAEAEKLDLERRLDDMEARAEEAETPRVLTALEAAARWARLVSTESEGTRAQTRP